jgi:hypothetical protein
LGSDGVGDVDEPDAFCRRVGVDQGVAVLGSRDDFGDRLGARVGVRGEIQKDREGGDAIEDFAAAVTGVGAVRRHGDRGRQQQGGQQRRALQSEKHATSINDWLDDQSRASCDQPIALS